MTDAAAINSTLQVLCCSESLVLDHRKCVYWPKRKVLMLADVHLGKEAVFQRRGMAIPDGAAQGSIERIRQLLTEYEVQQLLILGDLVHALPGGSESWITQFHNLTEQFKETRFVVVTGNHDKPGTPVYFPDSIHWTDRLTQPPFAFSHEPAVSGQTQNEPSYTICGHLHPCYRIGLRKGPSIRLPVFWFGQRQFVLPAFGEFTGMMLIKPQAKDRCFGVGPDGIVELTTGKAT